MSRTKQTPQFSRREFLTTAAAMLLAQNAESKNKEDNKWAFLNNKYKTNSKPDIAYLQKHFVPITEKNPPPKGSIEEKTFLTYVNTWGRKVLQQHNLSAKEVILDLAMQQYASPAPREIGESAKKHIEQSIDFMYSKLKGIKKVNPQWELVELGKKYTDKGNIALIGNSFAIAREMTLKHKNGKVLDQVRAITEHEGAFANFRRINGTKENDQYEIFVPANGYALNAGISEVLPLIMIEEELTLQKKVGYRKANLTTEGLQEAIAHLLGEEMCKEFNIPQGKETLTRLSKGRENLSRYSLVKPTINWIQQHGMQNAMNLWNKNPVEWYTRINLYAKASPKNQ